MLAPERRRASLAGAAGAVAGVALVFADLKRRRDDWLASLHAQQLGWHRSTSVVDAPGELARYVRDAVTLGHAQNLLYLTAVPLAAIGLVVLWRSGIRDGMFVFAAIAVVAPLATGSAMSLPRFLMGTFPYAVAGGILLDRVDRAPAHGAARWSSAAGLVGVHVGDLPRQRPCAVTLAIALAVVALHAGAALAYHGDGKDLPATYFYPRAHAIAHGTDAYGGLDYEYPPATLPLLVAPLAAGGDDSGQAYHQRTIWLYGALDVVCVLLLAWLLRRRPAIELALALGLYSVSVLVLGRLALTRFDLAAGLAILIAGALRAPRRAAPGAWLGLAGRAQARAARGRAGARAARARRCARSRPRRRCRSPHRSIYTLWSGELGLSWIGYHAGRDPEIESWAARAAPISPAASGRTRARPSTTAARTSRAATARWLGRLFAVASVGLALLLARRVRRADADPALALLAALAVLVAVAPVLSPQYLLWLAPLSALLAPALPAAGGAAGARVRADARRAALRVRRPAALRLGRDRARRAAQRSCWRRSRSRSGGVRLLGERAEDRPGRLELAVREREARLEPGGERLARLLVADQEPHQHVDARVRPRRSRRCGAAAATACRG